MGKKKMGKKSAVPQAMKAKVPAKPAKAANAPQPTSQNAGLKGLL